MKYLLIAAGLLPAFSAHAQREKWDTYLAMYDSKPGTVLVDMGLAATAPDKKSPYLVITGPTAHSCNDKGVAATAEIDKLEEMLDNTTSYLGGLTARTLVGTFAYNCERLNYYYVNDTIGVRNAINRMYGKNFPEYEYTIKIKYDPAWLAYRTFLFPDEKMQRWMENSKIITAMLQLGDSLTAKRDINFKFHFQTEQERAQFAGAVRSHDYKADKIFTTGDGLIYGIAVSKYENVRINLIDSMTTELKAEGKKYNGIYIGWDAPIQAGKR